MRLVFAPPLFSRRTVSGIALIFGAAFALVLAGGRPASAQLFVSASAANTIYKFDSAGNATVFATGGLINGPRGIAFDALGNVYIANASGNNILRFNPDGTGGIIFATGGFSTPNDLVFGPDGNLYVTNPGSGTSGIQRISAAGVNLGRFGPVFSGTRGLAFDASGNLIVSESITSTLQKIDTGGNQTLFASTNVTGPREIEFAPNGNLYVVNNTGNILRSYDAAGNFLATLPTNGISNPQGLAIGPDGTKYVINSSGTTGQIRRYSGTDTVLTAFTVPNGQTAFSAAFFVAPSVAPEPGTLALLAVAGIPLCGAVIRRRQQQRRHKVPA